MEVLAARYRTGDLLWTFDKKHYKSLEALASLGLVKTMHGIVENTVRASLTDAGVEMYISENYTPPFLKELETLKAKIQAYELIYNTREVGA